MDTEDTEEEIFEAAAALPAAERASFLDTACAGKPEIRASIEALLRSHDVTGFMAQDVAEAGKKELQSEWSRLQPEKAGQRIGHYKLMEQIGEGGFGVVWVAEQLEPVRRRVALKIIKPGMDSRQVVGRFEQERQALAMMDHPNIAKVFDAGATDKGRPYFVMELVRGVKITDYCDRENLPTAERLKLLITVCQAVQHAHQKGIIHRDLKPSNILVTPGDGGEPVPKVIDFGVAKAIQQQSQTDATVYTQFEQMVGTPAYMSPEQAGLGPMDIDTRSDVYSLGVLLYELLTGRPPFDSKTLLSAGFDEMRRVIREVEPPRPSTCVSTMERGRLDGLARNRRTAPPRLISALRGDLDWIAMKALEKNRARRYETANGLALDIQRFLHNDPVVARPPGFAYRAGKFVSKHKGPVLAAAAVLVALIAGLAASTTLYLREAEAWASEAVQRNAAKRNAQAESEARQLAQRAVTRLEIERAESLIQSGDSSKGLAYLARLLRQEPSNHVVRERVLSALTCRSFCLPVAPLQHGKSLNSVTGDLKKEFTDAFAFLRRGSLVSADFSPDGSCVVSWSRDGTARLWNAFTGAPQGEPLKHDAEVLNAQFSADSRRVVTVSVDRTAKVWSVDTGQLALPVLQHGDVVWFASFDSDGRRLVTASLDKTVRIWDALNGLPIGAPLPHPATPYFAAFSPDGRRILTAYEGHRASLWDGETRERIATVEHFYFKQYTDPFPRFGPRGQLATLRWRHAFLREGHPNLTKFVILGHDDYATGATYSPDGMRISTVSEDSTVRLWDTKTGTALTAPLKHGNAAKSAHFSADGQILVTASADRSARVWDVRTAQMLSEPLWQDRGVHSAKVSAGGQRIATVSETDTAWLWDVRILQPLTTVRSLPRACNGVKFHPSGDRFVVVDDADNIRICESKSGRFTGEAMKHRSSFPVTDFQFSPDGQRLATASHDKVAQMWDAATGAPLGPPLRHPGGVYHVRFSPDGNRLFTACDEAVWVWDVKSGKPLTEFRHQGDVNDISFSPDGSLVVTASRDATAQVWDAVTGQRLSGPLTHGDSVYCAVFDPSGKRVATASKDKTVRLWLTATGKPFSPPLEHADSLIRRDAIQFNFDGSRMLSVAGNIVQVWNSTTCHVVCTLRHGSLVRTALFSPDGRKLLTAAQDGIARLWDPESGQPVSEPLQHGSRLTGADLSADGSRVITCGTNKTVRIWEVVSAPLPMPDWLPTLAEAVAGQRIDAQDVSEMVPVNNLFRLRQTLGENTASDFYGRWARWFFADSTARPISPSSSTTVPEYVKYRIEEDTLKSLKEATRLAPTNARAFSRLAQKLVTPNESGKIPEAEDADWFSLYAAKLTPNDPEVQHIREEVIEKLQNAVGQKPTDQKP